MTADLKELEGTVVQVMCLERAKCPACNITIELNPDALTIKCQSCTLKFKVTSIKKMYFFGINIQDNEGKLHRLVCFQKAMEDFLFSEEMILLMNNEEQLVEYLLAMVSQNKARRRIRCNHQYRKYLVGSITLLVAPCAFR